MRDTRSPGFAIFVTALNPELRLQKPNDPRLLGQVLQRTTGESERVLDFTFEDNEKEFDVLKLRVDNHDFYYFDNPLWTKGNLVRFFFGYPGRVFGPRYAIVDSVRGFHELQVTCVELTSVSNETKNRKWENQSIQQILLALIAEKSFGPRVTQLTIDEDPFLQSPQTFQQARQSDWQFVQKLAEKGGSREVYVEDSTLFFVKRRFNATPIRRYEYWYGIGDLLNVSIKEWRATDRPAETTVAAWDATERKDLRATGSNTNTERDSLGKQNSVSIRPDQAGALQVRYTGSTVQTSAAKSQRAVTEEADARYRKQEQKEIELTVRVIGDPFVPAKSLIQIDGISRQLSGKYYVKKHVHQINRSVGYVGTMSLIRNAITAAPTQEPGTVDPTKARENTKGVKQDRRLVIRPNRAGRLVQTYE